MMSPDLADLSSALERYRANTTSLDDLKATILATAERVTEYDRRDLRKLLVEAEGRLDMIQFTTDSDLIHGTTLPVLDEIEDALAREGSTR